LTVCAGNGAVCPEDDYYCADGEGECLYDRSSYTSTEKIFILLTLVVALGIFIQQAVHKRQEGLKLPEDAVHVANPMIREDE